MSKEVRAYSNQKLIDAAQNGDLKKVKEAIKAGANFCEVQKIPVDHAIRNRDLDMVKYLTENGFISNNHLISSGNACRTSLDVLKYLVKNNGATFVPYASTFALEKGRIELAQFISLCMREDKMAKNLVKIMLKDV